MSTAKFDQWLNPNGTENYKTRAWVNFNGTGTVAIRASGNVASITDNGVGDYTVNFATAMPDANYAFIATVSATAISSGSTIASAPFATTPTVSACRFVSATSAATSDTLFANVAIFR